MKVAVWKILKFPIWTLLHCTCTWNLHENFQKSWRLSSLYMWVKQFGTWWAMTHCQIMFRKKVGRHPLNLLVVFIYSRSPALWNMWDSRTRVHTTRRSPEILYRHFEVLENPFKIIRNFQASTKIWMINFSELCAIYNLYHAFCTKILQIWEKWR
jgi:hypothetical protein